MILTQDDVTLPYWVRESIMMNCPHCGAPIASNNDSGQMTERWCSNPKCPEHMGYRIAYIAKHYNVKGFGPAAGKAYYTANNPDSPCAIISTWFEEKPKETLSTIADLACIKDFGKTTGQKFLDKYTSFTEYFETDPNVDMNLLAHREELLCAEKYFTIKKPYAGENIYVMATGIIHGYSNRDMFFQELNELVGDKIHIIQTGLRKTNVTCLVKEEDAVDHRKSKVAKECGIAILTPKQFIAMLANLYKELGGDVEDLRRKYNENGRV